VSAPPADLPVRSNTGMAALDIFYSDFNEVNFYVEDAEQENLYFEILKKLFESVSITRIFPLGGKPAVFQHATSEANQRIKCFRAYIVDRDFDHLLKIELEHPNVFYLDRFCIENYLLEDAAIVEVVIESHPKLRKTDVEIALSLNTQIPALFGCLRPLFLLFFCAQSLNLGVKNCSLRPETFCEPKRLWELKGNAIVNYRDGLSSITQASGLGSDLFDSQCDAAISQADIVSDHELISGKFVATMLFHYVKSKYVLGSITFESFVYRLAKNCTLQSMRAFAEGVQGGIDSHRQSVPNT